MKRKLISLLAALLMMSPVSVSAAEGILSGNYDNGVFSAYIDLPDDGLAVTGVYADGIETGNSEFRKLNENDRIKTVFVADRSALDGEGSEVFSGVLKEMLSLSGENEEFCFMTSGSDGLKTVTEFTANQMQIMNASENAEPEEGTADFNVLLSSLAETNESTEQAFKRYIVFTTSEAVNSADKGKITGSDIPVFFVLTDSGSPDDSILNSVPGIMGYCAGLHGTDYSKSAEMAADLSDIYYFSTELSESLIGTGGEKRIGLTIENEQHSYAFEKCIDTGDHRYAAAEKSLNRMKILLVIVSLSAFLLLAVLVMILRKRKITVTDSDNDEPARMTVSLSRKNESSGTVFGSASTKLLFHENEEKKIYLTETENPANVIEISSLKDTTIGRNQALSDVVIYNERSVSQKHCRVFCRNSKVYVDDLGSLNHTYVDGEEVTGETEIFSGSLLKIGRVSFRVSIE